jgi:hypothetical protein
MKHFQYTLLSVTQFTKIDNQKLEALKYKIWSCSNFMKKQQAFTAQL